MSFKNSILFVMRKWRMSHYSILLFKPICLTILGPLYFPDYYYAVAIRFTKWLLAVFKAGPVCDWWSGDTERRPSVSGGNVSECVGAIVTSSSLSSWTISQTRVRVYTRYYTGNLWRVTVDRIVSFKDIQIWISGISLIFAIYLLVCEIVVAPVCANHSIKVFSMNSLGILVNV